MMHCDERLLKNVPIFLLCFLTESTWWTSVGRPSRGTAWLSTHTRTLKSTILWQWAPTATWPCRRRPPRTRCSSTSVLFLVVQPAARGTAQPSPRYSQNRRGAPGPLDSPRPDPVPGQGPGCGPLPCGLLRTVLRRQGEELSRHRPAAVWEEPPAAGAVHGEPPDTQPGDARGTQPRVDFVGDFTAFRLGESCEVGEFHCDSALHKTCDSAMAIITLEYLNLEDHSLLLGFTEEGTSLW